MISRSIGTVSRRGPGITAEGLLAAADRAAYEAKASGRNAIAAAPPIEKGGVCAGLTDFSSGCMQTFEAADPVGMTMGRPAARRARAPGRRDRRHQDAAHAYG